MITVSRGQGPARIAEGGVTTAARTAAFGSVFRFPHLFTFLSALLIALPIALLSALLPVSTATASPGGQWRGGFNMRGADGSVDAAIETADGLVIGGGFHSVGRVVGNHVALWDGASWHSLGDGFNGDVETFTVFRGDLIAGGSFTSSGDRTIGGIARWDGMEWVPLGAGTDGAVHALVQFHGDLFAGGRFTRAGGWGVEGIARWDGSDWHSTDLNPPSSVARIQVVHAVATSDTLYASWDSFNPYSGAFLGIDMVKWDGVEWTYVNRSNQLYPADLVLSSGTLYGVGYRYSDAWAGAARWTGRDWSVVGGALGHAVIPRRIFAYENSFYVATESSIYSAGSDTSGTIVRLQGADWVPVPGQMRGDRSVLPLATFGSSMVVAGTRDAEPTPVASVAFLDGSSWQALDEGVGNGCDGAVHHLASVGSNVYLSGDFESVGGAPIGNGSAVWNGSALEATPGFPHWGALADFRGDPVVAGFDGICNPGFMRVALLQNGNWTTVGEFDERVKALTVWNDRIIAGGWFTSSCRAPVHFVAAMDGAQVTSLGAGPGHPVNRLTTYRGNLLEAGSTCMEWNGETWRDLGNLDVSGDAVEHAGGLVTPEDWGLRGTVRRWDGRSWRQLGGGFNGRVDRVAVYHGSLVVGGEFDSLGGRAIGHLARWNGIDWEPLGTGIDGDVEDLCAMGDDLYVGGRFRSAGGEVSSCLAMWSEGVPVLPSFEAAMEDTTIHLAWSGSTSPGYAGVRVRYSIDDVPTGPRDGLPVENGNDGIFHTPPGQRDSLRIAVRLDGAKMHFAAFAFDSLDRAGPPLYAEADTPDRVAPTLHLFVVPSASGGTGVQVILHPSEVLDSATVALSVDGRGNRMARGEGTDWVWNWPAPEGDSIAIIATAADSSGNNAAASRSMSARRIGASSGGTLSSADGKVRIDFPAGSLTADRYVTITAESDPRAYQILPRENLRAPAVLTFLDVDSSDSLAITNWERGGRERTFMNRRDRVATASIPSLGCYQLLIVRPGPLSEIDPGFFAGLPPAPNPFRTDTHIRFETHDVRSVRIRIFDVTGRDVARPFDSFEGPGVQDILWSGRDRAGRRVPAGCYFYSIESRGKVVTGRLLKVR